MQSNPGNQTHTGWTFLTNYTHILVCLIKHPDMRLRDIALHVGITERSTARIVTELEEAGVIEKEKVGRRNQYSINLNAPLRHPVEAGHTVGDLLKMIIKP
jgi:predicted transcriptional regulator